MTKSISYLVSKGIDCKDTKWFPTEIVPWKAITGGCQLLPICPLDLIELFSETVIPVLWEVERWKSLTGTLKVENVAKRVEFLGGGDWPDRCNPGNGAQTQPSIAKLSANHARHFTFSLFFWYFVDFLKGHIELIECSRNGKDLTHNLQSFSKKTMKLIEI